MGIATWYSVQSTKAEGNTGITASGEKLNENALTCAVRSRNFGTRYKVTNLKTGKTIVCRHNDFGPGKKPAKRGVIIDLTPKAFDSLGGKRGKYWGEFPAKVVAL
jgi:rare lipoprotein A